MGENLAGPSGQLHAEFLRGLHYGHLYSTSLSRTGDEVHAHQPAGDTSVEAQVLQEAKRMQLV